MKGINVIIIGLLVLAAFIQLARTDPGAPSKAPSDDDDDDDDHDHDHDHKEDNHGADTDTDDEHDDDDDDDDGELGFGILNDDIDDLRLGKDGFDEYDEEYVVEEDKLEHFTHDGGRYGTIKWKTGENPDEIFKRVIKEKTRNVPTMTQSYVDQTYTGRNPILLNVKDEWNKNPGNPIYGLNDLDKKKQSKCADKKKALDCKHCCTAHQLEGHLVKVRDSFGLSRTKCQCIDSNIEF